MNLLFKGLRIDHQDLPEQLKWVKGYYFKTPLTTENFNCEPNFFSQGVIRHCISTEMGVVYEVVPESVGIDTAIKTEYEW